jgi:transposase InsO family protein
LAVVVDLFSRMVIGWSMQSRITKDIVLNALLMAVWRRNPKQQVMVHSDQGSQYQLRLASFPERPWTGRQHEPTGELP